MLDYEKIKAYHHSKRLKDLAKLFYDRNPIYDLNTGIIDNDEVKIKINLMKLDILKYKYVYETFEYLKTKDKKRVAYLLPHNFLTGGLKIIIEQANRLLLKGYDVTLLCHMPKPDWIDIKCRYIQVLPDNTLAEFVHNTDIVIAGYWDLIIDAMKTDAPLKYYFAQGDIDIFEYENLNPLFRNLCYTAHQLPVKILTISRIMETKIRELYNRKSEIIPNAIDKNFFYQSSHEKDTPKNILIIGRDNLLFKGTGDIIKALYLLKLDGYELKIKWVTPTLPTKDYSFLRLNIEYIIRPTQEELGNIYRNSDIFISGSYYEAFSLPPLEAMACGTAVITASNDGVKEYAIDNYNCLMYKPGDVNELILKIKELIKSKAIRDKIVINGLDTAKKFTWERSIKILGKEIDTDIKNLKLALLEL